MTTKAQRIYDSLQQAFSPLLLEVIDDSHRHAGHAGAKAEGETHYTVKIISNKFNGLSRIQVHKQVYAALSADKVGDIHALAIQASAPSDG